MENISNKVLSINWDYLKTRIKKHNSHVLRIEWACFKSRIYPCISNLNFCQNWYVIISKIFFTRGSLVSGNAL